MYKIFSDKILAISFFAFYADFSPVCYLMSIQLWKNLFLILKVERQLVFLIHSDLGLKFSRSLPYTHTIFLMVLSKLCFNIHYLLDETYHNGGGNDGEIIQKEFYWIAGLFLWFFLCKNQNFFRTRIVFFCYSEKTYFDCRHAVSV